MTYPDFALFKRNVALIEDDLDKARKISYWIDCMRKQKQGALVISIYLYQDDLNQAWQEFRQRKDQFQMNEPLLLKLFKEMKKQDPSKLIPIYSDFIMKNISYRERSTYAKAARWMKDLKEVWFRSLMEEIRAVGIE